VRVANAVVARARNGYPEIGLPVLDPLRIDKMNVDQGGDGPVNLKISLRNVNLIGLSGTRFIKIAGFKQNIDRSKIELHFIHPFMRIEGPYKLNGKVLVLPVQGSGIANISLSELRMTKNDCDSKLIYYVVSISSRCQRSHEDINEKSRQARKKLFTDRQVKAEF
jgi:hypothetical protein